MMLKKLYIIEELNPYVYIDLTCKDKDIKLALETFDEIKELPIEHSSSSSSEEIVNSDSDGFVEKDLLNIFIDIFDENSEEEEVILLSNKQVMSVENESQNLYDAYWFYYDNLVYKFENIIDYNFIDLKKNNNTKEVMNYKPLKSFIIYFHNMIVAKIEIVMNTLFTYYPTDQFRYDYLVFKKPIVINEIYYDENLNRLFLNNDSVSMNTYIHKNIIPYTICMDPQNINNIELEMMYQLQTNEKKHKKVRNLEN